MTTTNNWKVDADGDWSTVADWSLGRLPNSGDAVTISTADVHSITHNGGSSDPDMKAFAVMPRISPRTCVVTTVTPVTNDAMTRRKIS